MSRRYANKKDNNHNAITSDFESLGCDVLDTSAVGDDFPDTVVSIPPFFNILVEIKDGSKYPSERKLSEGQQKLFDRWHSPIEKVESRDDVVRLVEKYRKLTQAIQQTGLRL